MLTHVKVTFETDTLENAKEFSKVFAEEIDHYSGVSNHFEELTYPLTSSDPNAPKYHNYVSGVLSFRVETPTLSDEMDSIPSFMRAASESTTRIVPKINDNWSVTVFMNDEPDGTQIHEAVYHLYRASQEDMKLLSVLENQNTLLHMEMIKLQARVESIETKYNSLMAYLHTGINIKALVDIVVETANTVDPDIMQRNQLHPVRIQ